MLSTVVPHLDERQRRIVVGATARALGRGGIVAVAEGSGMSRSTVQKAVGEIDAGVEVSARVRPPGAGRPRVEDAQPGLLVALDDLVEPEARGDPMCPLRWTAKSTRTLASQLRAQGYEVSHVTVGELLHRMGYSLQAPAKENEGAAHPDRDAQFGHIDRHARAHLAAGQPVVSVDTKKKEVVGNLRNGGREWQPTGTPVRVDVHDFPDPEIGKAIPYGVFDIAANEGFVAVGDDADTAEFAVTTIGRWWDEIGSVAYPDATRLLITADAGGSNGYRNRLWKLRLSELAARTGLEITVCHFPPGTSKWNTIEHRLFSYIARNWRGQPLTSRQVIVSLIGATTSTAGLKVYAQLDENTYERAIKISDAQLAAINITKDKFHGEWNYVIEPKGC